MTHVQMFLMVQAVAFALAAFVHAGVVATGYQHREAALAEAVIAVVLALGLVVSVASPRWSRAAGFVAQGFALAGTIVGVVMIAIGVGPQSFFDILLHAGFIALLTAGLIVAARTPAHVRFPG